MFGVNDQTSVYKKTKSQLDLFIPSYPRGNENTTIVSCGFPMCFWRRNPKGQAHIVVGFWFGTKPTTEYSFLHLS